MMTLADLRRAAELLPPGASLTLPREALLAALDGDVAQASGEAPAEPNGPDGERWLTAVEVAPLLSVTPRWCYDHAAQLGAKRLSRRCVRFSARAVQRYMARRG